MLLDLCLQPLATNVHHLGQGHLNLRVDHNESSVRVQALVVQNNRSFNSISRHVILCLDLGPDNSLKKYTEKGGRRSC